MENYNRLICKGFALTPVHPRKREGDRFFKGKVRGVDAPYFEAGWTEMTADQGNALAKYNISKGDPFYAVRTGEISDVIGVDTDTASADAQGIARAIEFEEMCKAAGTYTVKTPNGWHYYFKYDDEISKSTSICGYIDIQSNDKCLFAPNVKRTDGQYEVVNDGPVLPMTPEIKSFILSKPTQGAVKSKKKREPKDKQMVESPAATNELISKPLSTNEMEKYWKNRNKYASTTVDWNEFKRLCDHLRKENFVPYNLWTKIGWALANVSDHNNYKDDALKEYERLSELHCPEKYNKTITCSEIFENRRFNGSQLGWTYLKSCVDEDYRLYSFIDDVGEDNDIIKDMIEMIEKYKDDVAHTKNAADIVSHYFKTHKGDNIVYDSKLQTWACCNEQNIWLAETKPLSITRVIKDVIGPLFKARSKKYKALARVEEDKDQKEYLKECWKNLQKFEVMCSTPHSVDGIIDFLKTNHEKLGFWEDYIDKNPNVFAFNNKVLIKETGEIRDIRPDDYISMNTGYSLPVKDEEAMKEVREIIASMQKTKEDSDFIIRIFSEHLFGSNKEEKIYIHTGSGSNGKSIIIDLMKKAFGKYYLNLSPETLTKAKKGPNDTSELHDGKGKRMVIVSEPEADKDNKLQASWLKGSTSDELTVRGLFKNPITFLPQFRINIQCNDIPSPTKSDGGFDRRIQIIVYPFKFTDEDHLIESDPNTYKLRDANLRDKIRLDTRCRDALIWILIDTYQEIKDTPFVVPKTFRDATNQYLTDSNDVKCFMFEKTEKNDEMEENKKTGKDVPKHRVLLKDLFATFKRWMKDNNRDNKIQTLAAFSNKLKADQYAVGPYGNKKLSHCFNIILLDDYDSDGEAESD